METTFYLNASELDEKFLQAVRQLFTEQDIIIQVRAEPDTTDYLLSDPQRKAALLRSLQEARSGELIEVNLTDYQG